MEAALKASSSRAAAAASEVGRLQVDLERQRRVNDEGRAALAALDSARADAAAARRRVAEAGLASDRLREQLAAVSRREREASTRAEEVAAEVGVLREALRGVERRLGNRAARQQAAAAAAGNAVRALERHLMLGSCDEIDGGTWSGVALSAAGCELLAQASDAVREVEALLLAAADPSARDQTSVPPTPPSQTQTREELRGKQFGPGESERRSRPRSSSKPTAPVVKGGAASLAALPQSSQELLTGSVSAAAPSTARSNSSSSSSSSSNNSSGGMLREYQQAILRARQRAEASEAEATALRRALAMSEARAHSLVDEADAARAAEARETDRCRRAEAAEAEALAGKAGAERRCARGGEAPSAAPRPSTQADKKKNQTLQLSCPPRARVLCQGC